MKAFMDKDFLLSTETAKVIFENGAKDTPIFDWHCHLSPKEIYEDKSFENITKIWLGGDHYKWRAMRGCGVDEKYITGDASDYEKFMKWAESLPLQVTFAVSDTPLTSRTTVLPGSTAPSRRSYPGMPPAYTRPDTEIGELFCL